jgi:hypothetical protein
MLLAARALSRLRGLAAVHPLIAVTAAAAVSVLAVFERLTFALMLRLSGTLGMNGMAVLPCPVCSALRSFFQSVSRICGRGDG